RLTATDEPRASDKVVPHRRDPVPESDRPRDSNRSRVSFDLLEDHDRIRPYRNGRARGDRDSLPRTDGTGESPFCEDLADQAKDRGTCRAGATGIRTPYGVPVPGSSPERGDVAGRPNVDRGDATERRLKRDVLRPLDRRGSGPQAPAGRLDRQEMPERMHLHGRLSTDPARSIGWTSARRPPGIRGGGSRGTMHNRTLPGTRLPRRPTYGPCGRAERRRGTSPSG